MKEIVSFVDQSYCINLDTRPDRWKDISSEFRHLGIFDSVSRMSGIPDKHRELGCLKAHLQCVQDAIENNHENILIMEDDVSFLPFNNGILKEIVNFLRTDHTWDLFYLGGYVNYPAKFVRKNIFKSHIYCAHAYIVNRRIFTHIMSATPPIDNWYAKGDLTTYGIYPLYAIQKGSYSDIRNKEMKSRMSHFAHTYKLYVQPNILVRWANYFLQNYIIK